VQASVQISLNQPFRSTEWDSEYGLQPGKITHCVLSFLNPVIPKGSDATAYMPAF